MGGYKLAAAAGAGAAGCYYTTQLGSSIDNYHRYLVARLAHRYREELEDLPQAQDATSMAFTDWHTEYDHVVLPVKSTKPDTVVTSKSMTAEGLAVCVACYRHTETLPWTCIASARRNVSILFLPKFLYYSTDEPLPEPPAALSRDSTVERPVTTASAPSAPMSSELRDILSM